MLPPQAVKEIHLALQTIYQDSVVLLGGSYWTGEASNGSDLDFYILRPLIHFFAYKRQLPAVETVKEQYSGVTINCMVMPRFFYDRGWYYVAGESVDGAAWQSPLNTKIVHRTAMKLAYWNYLLYLLAETQAEKQITLAKMAQHLAVASAVLEVVVTPQRGFTVNFLIEHVPEDSCWNSVRKLLLAKRNRQTFSVADLDKLSADLFSLAERLCAEHPRLWRFSFPNYIIYNAKFLRHRNTLFLFKNPDKMIVNRLRGELQKGDTIGQTREELRTIVFPVIMI